MGSMDDKKIDFSIIGTGRFGCFWGQHLSRFFPVSFYDTDESRKPLVESYGTWAPLKECLDKNFIFLTIPIRKIENFLRDHAGDFKPGSVILDCASVKMAILEWFQKYLPENIYFTATHPLFGPDSARNGLEGHTITVIPGRIPFHQYNFLVNLFCNSMKLRALNISAEEHDRLMAYNLSLIHHLGRTFHDMNISQVSLKMASLSKLNHIARVTMNDSEELFYDFCHFNPFAREVEENFLSSFRKISANIEAYFEWRKKLEDATCQ